MTMHEYYREADDYCSQAERKIRVINVDDFISKLEELYQYAGWDRREIHFSLADIICNLDMMPTVEAEPVRHGRWEEE